MKIDVSQKNNTSGSSSDPDHPKAGASVDADSGMEQDKRESQDSGNNHSGTELS
jgi:hypothetical protein